MNKDEAIHCILSWLWNRYGHALTPEEQAMFVLGVSGILSDAIDAEVYQILRRQSYSQN